MVETRRSSASSKRSLPATTSTTSSSSPPPNPPNKRSKTQEEVPTSSQLETRCGSQSHDDELGQSDSIVDQDAATKESTTVAPEPAAVEKSDVNGGGGEGPTEMEVVKSVKAAVVAMKRIPQRSLKSASKVENARKAAKVAAIGSAVGALHLGGTALRYSKSPHGEGNVTRFCFVHRR